MKVNGTNFDLEYCASFNPTMLRKIYNGESKETLEELIEIVHGKTKEDGLQSNSNNIEGERLPNISNERRASSKSSRKKYSK